MCSSRVSNIRSGCSRSTSSIATAHGRIGDWSTNPGRRQSPYRGQARSRPGYVWWQYPRQFRPGCIANLERWARLPHIQPISMAMPGTWYKNIALLFKDVFASAMAER